MTCDVEMILKILPWLLNFWLWEKVPFLILSELSQGNPREKSKWIRRRKWQYSLYFLLLASLLTWLISCKIITHNLWTIKTHFIFLEWYISLIINLRKSIHGTIWNMIWKLKFQKIWVMKISWNILIRNLFNKIQFLTML